LWVDLGSLTLTCVVSNDEDYLQDCKTLQQEHETDKKLTRIILCIVRHDKKGKVSSYSIAERRVPELIPVLGSQPAGDVSHQPCGRLPLLSARPAVTPATLKRAATSFAAW